MPVRRLVIDYEKGLLSVTHSDGVIRVEPSRQTPPSGPLELIRSEYDLATCELHLTLRSRGRITLEIGAPGAGDQPAADRRVLYLDQNHWRTLARALHDPGVLAAEQAEAAATVIALARDKRIILPLSSAHTYETGRTYGPLRRELATTMLDLSRGWQMRNPLRVRHEELARALAGLEPSASAVFTLEPDVLFSAPSGVAAPIDAPKSAQALHRRLTDVSSIAAAMMEDVHHDAAAGRRLAAHWANYYEDLSTRLHADGAAASEVRMAAFTALLDDLGDDIAKAAQAASQPPDAVARWKQARARSDFARMPYLSRLEELLFRRIRNAGESWHGNDLTDGHFLSCAAGYADVVAGERRHAAYLAAGSTGDGAYVCRTLHQAVAWLTAEH